MISNLDLALTGLVSAGTRMLSTASNLARANTSQARAATAHSDSAERSADNAQARSDAAADRSQAASYAEAAPRSDSAPRQVDDNDSRRRDKVDISLPSGPDEPGATVSIAKEMTNITRERLVYRANAAIAHADAEAIGKRLDLFDTTSQSLWSSTSVLESR